MAKAEQKLPIAFIDKAYKSRTIVLADGSAHKVMQGRITATSPDLLAHLEKHVEFERAPSAGEGE